MLLKILYAISNVPKPTVASNVSRAKVSKSVIDITPFAVERRGHNKNVRLPDVRPERCRPPAVM